jgi:hypothetical protein
MKLVNKSINRDGSVSFTLRVELTEKGHVTLRPEDDEDMWHVYNLIAEVSLFPTIPPAHIKLLMGEGPRREDGPDCRATKYEQWLFVKYKRSHQPDHPIHSESV